MVPVAGLLGQPCRVALSPDSGLGGWHLQPFLTSYPLNLLLVDPITHGTKLCCNFFVSLRRILPRHLHNPLLQKLLLLSKRLGFIPQGRSVNPQPLAGFPPGTSQHRDDLLSHLALSLRAQAFFYRDLQGPGPSRSVYRASAVIF